VRMKTRGEMRAFLTPEQLPKFEQYIQRMDEERKKQKEAQGR
jgi:Spy/CpxP family protein refolding chaperone